ncbi:hypothetical protein, partial [uncultured Sutterella sp.]|uniref:hypothetical protein n=1 Tax=uncultured Sutterella sp. TaxID=286133 RepID=UPI0026148D48
FVDAAETWRVEVMHGNLPYIEVYSVYGRLSRKNRPAQIFTFELGLVDAFALVLGEGVLIEGRVPFCSARA